VSIYASLLVFSRQVVVIFRSIAVSRQICSW